MQIQIADYLRACLPPPPEGPWWTHPHNEGQRSGIDAVRAQQMGQRAGTPDLLMVWRCGVIAIELKAGRTGTSAGQDATHADLRACGAAVHVCRSLDDVVAVLDGHGVPLRGRPAPLHGDAMAWPAAPADREQGDR
ncbi:hypothetical protein P7L78_22060 [Tistrella bauzanensis]|uniref:hypothetical protein n=1 Tax=Tistrella TaxID=171436 RepID=UPI0031F6404F